MQQGEGALKVRSHPPCLGPRQTPFSGLMESKVDFVAVDFPQANRLTVHILSAVAEHEAHMTSERTKAAVAAAKARGKRLGGLRWGFAFRRQPRAQSGNQGP